MSKPFSVALRLQPAFDAAFRLLLRVKQSHVRLPTIAFQARQPQCGTLLRKWGMIIAGWLLAHAAAAQVPARLGVYRATALRQTSSMTTEPAGAVFVAEVSFDYQVASEIPVQLRLPSGAVLPLTRLSPYSYHVERPFASLAEVTTQFPDGSYALVVGGSAATTTAFTLGSNPVPESPLLANIDELQAWPESFSGLYLRWLPLFGVTETDYVSIHVFEGDRVVFSAGLVGYLGTQYGIATPLNGSTGSGTIAYVKASSVLANDRATRVSTGNGALVRFTLRAVPFAPRIVRHPISTMVRMGGAISLSASASGAGVEYQWLKNGVPLPGATRSELTLDNAQAGNGGAYAVVATNSLGAARSTTAEVRIPSALRFETIAGMLRQPGIPDGPGETARLARPAGIAVDVAGNVYVSELASHTIRKIGNTGVVTTLAGSAGVRGRVDGKGTAARFDQPRGLAVDADGNVFVADTNNHAIRRIAPDGTVNTVAGGTGSGLRDGAANIAQFSFPFGVAVDARGNLFVTDSANDRVRQISAGIVSTLAGGEFDGSRTDGMGSAARFIDLDSIGIDATGNLYVTERRGSVRKVTPDGVVTTLVGMEAKPPGGRVHISSPVGDGLGTAVSLQLPTGIAIAPNGDIYVLSNRHVHCLFANGVVARVAGEGITPSNPDGSMGAQTFFSQPLGIAVDRTGAVYVANTQNHVVDRGVVVAGNSDPGIALVSSPVSHRLALGASVSWSVDAVGPRLTYQWLKDGAVIAGATSATLLLRNLADDRSAYAVRVGNAIGAVTSNSVRVTFDASSDVGRLVNLSVRSIAGDGAEALTAGFVVSGENRQASKPVLVRGIGPTLRDFGIAIAAADPRLALYRGTVVIQDNDNWGGTAQLTEAFSAVAAFPLAPASADAALTTALPAGAYTIQVAANGRPVLAEVYDATGDPNATGIRLVNLSARTRVGSGADLLVTGFVIGGRTSKTLMIRGVGPTLREFGVSEALGDPKLEIFSGAARIAMNDDWSDDATLRVTAQQIGAFRLNFNSRDAALIVTLPPGAYTAQVSSVLDAAGSALVEVYEVP